MLPGLMRRLTITSLLLPVVVLSSVVGCGASDDGPPASTTSLEAPPTTSVDPALAAMLIEPRDLSPDFIASASVDDTITRFCATEDAAAGLQASARVVQGLMRDGGGTSVIQLVFRFTGDGAARFVSQAAGALERCDGVPDLTGLAFEYEPLSSELTASLAEATSAVGRYGVNVGSGSLRINVVVMQHDDVGQLIAVLGVDLPRAELDSVTGAALRAALAQV